MAIADDLADRFAAAIVATDATQGDGAPAIRVQFVGATDVTITAKALADNLADRFTAAFIESDSAQGDGAPAVRGRSV